MLHSRLGPLLFLIWGILDVGSAQAGPEEERFISRLRGTDPVTAGLFEQAETARTARDWAVAEGLYAQVVAASPKAEIALRRQALAVLEQGRRGEAVALARAAVRIDERPENQLALARTLAGLPGLPRPGLHGGREALAILSTQRILHPEDPRVHRLSLEVATMLSDARLQQTSAHSMRQLAPGDPAGWRQGWEEAVSRRDGSTARFMMGRFARLVGAEAPELREMEEATAAVQPAGSWLGPLVFLVVVGWTACLLVLIAVGSLLSWLAMRVARRITRTGTSRDLTWIVGAAYRGVLWAGAAYYYYLSQVLVIVFVLVGAGVGAWQFATVMHASSLPFVTAIVAAAVGTVAAVLRGFFRARPDWEPGSRLNLAEHPAFLRLLQQVAARVGTAPIELGGGPFRTCARRGLRDHLAVDGCLRRRSDRPALWAPLRVRHGEATPCGPRTRSDLGGRGAAQAGRGRSLEGYPATRRHARPSRRPGGGWLVEGRDAPESPPRGSTIRRSDV